MLNFWRLFCLVLSFLHCPGEQGYRRNHRMWVHTLKIFLFTFSNLQMKKLKSKEGRGLLQSQTWNLWPLGTRTQASCPLVKHLIYNVRSLGPGTDLWILTSISSMEPSLTDQSSTPSPNKSGASGATLAGLRDAEEVDSALWKPEKAPGMRFTDKRQAAVSSSAWSHCSLSLVRISIRMASLPVLLSSTGRYWQGPPVAMAETGTSSLSAIMNNISIKRIHLVGLNSSRPKRERREEGSGRKAFYDLSTHNCWHLSLEKKKKKPTANINNYASFCIALCSFRRAFESIISSQRVCGRLRKWESTEGWRLWGISRLRIPGSPAWWGGWVLLQWVAAEVILAVNVQSRTTAWVAVFPGKLEQVSTP